jgi:hypothetical protein
VGGIQSPLLGDLMRSRLVVFFVVAAALGLNASVASAAPPPQQDSVTGNALVDYSAPFYGTAVTINAASDATGANASGSVSINICTFFIQTRTCDSGGAVTCMNVSDNRAIIGYRGQVLAPAGFSRMGRFIGLIEVTDNGPAGTDTLGITSTFRETNLDPPQDLPITDCPATLVRLSQDFYRKFAVPATSVLPQYQQDYVVADAQPLPTSKDQCKNGGWRNYGSTFKNQGQCVAFVQHGPKP